MCGSCPAAPAHDPSGGCAARGASPRGGADLAPACVNVLRLAVYFAVVLCAASARLAEHALRAPGGRAARDASSFGGAALAAGSVHFLRLVVSFHAVLCVSPARSAVQSLRLPGGGAVV